MSDRILMQVSSGTDFALETMTDCRDTVQMHVPYTPPYEPFGTLRELQLRIRAAQVGGKNVGKLILDVSEWISHPQDEYIRILAMFLADHPQYHCLFTVCCSSRKQALPLFVTLRQYLDGSMEEDSLFEDPVLLQQYLQSDCTPAAARILTRLLMQPQSASWRGYDTVAHILAEIRQTMPAQERPIDVCHLRNCAQCRDSLLCLVFEDRLQREIGSTVHREEEMECA